VTASRPPALVRAHAEAGQLILTGPQLQLPVCECSWNRGQHKAPPHGETGQ
jgi:hypothetical protein